MMQDRQTARRETFCGPATNGGNQPMIRKLIICAVIALVLVPAGVMAAGFGGQNAGTASGQGQCLHNGENCANHSDAPGSGNQTQYRYGAQQNGETGTHGCQNGQCTNEQEHTRSMQRLHDGSCTGCKNVPVTQP
jgi:hypothetical protein